MTKLIMLSKYCLSGDDNLLSFNLECLNNVKILSNTKLKFQIQKVRKKFISQSNDNLNNLIK